MRKFLFGLLILILCGLIFLIAWYDIPALSMDYTYSEIQALYQEYQTTLKDLDTKINVDLPNAEKKLSDKYAETDSTNVKKLYKEKKQEYEDLLAKQQANKQVDEADIYNVEYLWKKIGDAACAKFIVLDDGSSKQLVSSNVVLTMNVIKSEADLESEDYIMCNLKFDFTGLYDDVINLIDFCETEETLGFQINDFFMQGYYETAKNQTISENMDTDNLPVATGEEEESDKTFEQSGEEDDPHRYDVVGSFTVYNVPVNRRNITNVKVENAGTTDETTEEGTEATV